jgi:hypothetical protein
VGALPPRPAAKALRQLAQLARNPVALDVVALGVGVQDGEAVDSVSKLIGERCVVDHDAAPMKTCVSLAGLRKAECIGGFHYHNRAAARKAQF